MQELHALKKLQHPNIIQLHEIIDDPKEDRVYLVMDVLDGGTIEDKVKVSAGGLLTKEMWKWSRQIVQAVWYCHSVANICHRDLKAENVMLNKA